MLSTKMSLVTLCAFGFALSACNTNKTNLTPQQKAILQEQQKALPQTLQIKSGAYNVTVECADATKTEKLKTLHWVVNFKPNEQYLESQQNFDLNCEDACSAVETGSVRVNEAQAVFTVSQRLNAKNEYESVATPTSKTYFVMSYDRIFSKLTLIDNSDKNVCQGKMILTLQQ
ncbi:MAG: hypothetical protein JSU04_15400 [Bdellovibrionales bacterium]|nr:hypothetical protein [Bdellovibrionales bacterium]